MPTTFLKSWINNRYLELITSLFQAEDSEILKVEILVRTATRGVGKPAEAPVSPEPVAAAQTRRPAAQHAGQIAQQAVSSAAAARPTTAGQPLFGSPLDSASPSTPLLRAAPTA